MKSFFPGWLAVPVHLMLICLPVSVLAQQQKVSFWKDNVRLEEMLKSLHEQTGMPYSYRDRRLLDIIVTVHQKDVSPEECLLKGLQPYPVKAEIMGKAIAVTPKNPGEFPAGAASPALMNVRVTVKTKDGNPVEKVSLQLNGSRKKGCVTDKEGSCVIPGVAEGASLHYSHVSMKPGDLKIAGPAIQISMENREHVLDSVINNGYQRIPRILATGSFDFVNHDLFNRSVSPNWMGRLENITPGLLFNHGGLAADGSTTPDPILIRGRSTIYANAAPLVVVDNFPYDGDPANINPNDVESVTILKDAAAASIWGVRAGNGVIVLTMKKGQGKTPRVVLQTNLSFTGRPDLANIHAISGSDYIDFEKKLYTMGYYPTGTGGPGDLSVSPVVALLQAADSGSISGPLANARIEALKKTNVLDDLSRLFYRNSIERQHYVQVSGQSDSIRYFFSGGWDHNLANLAETQYDRFTLRMQNSISLTHHFQVEAGLNYAEDKHQNGNNAGASFLTSTSAPNLYPYAKLADSRGNALPVNLYHSAAFIQQTAQAGLLDWSYSPLADLTAEKNTLITRDWLVNLGGRYAVASFLNLDLKYQYENQSAVTNDLHGDASFYTRDLINQFSQVDPITHQVSRPIPEGGILDMNTTSLVSHQGRAQASYHQYLGNVHDVSAIGGAEVKSLVIASTTDRLYGWDPATHHSDPNIDYRNPYPQYPAGPGLSIPKALPFTQTTDDFISYFGNAAYTYDSRYTATVSAREDMANLFGAQTNGKAVPLWSAGLAWTVSHEDFFHRDWLSSLKLRATIGRNGNISRQTSAYATAVYSPGGVSGSTYINASLQNLSNDHLRWEQAMVTNFGVDFATTDTIFSGTFEYYIKKGEDLTASNAVDPTLGVIRNAGAGSYAISNSATLEGHGADLQLEARIVRGRNFRWTANGIYSYAASHIMGLTAPNGVGNLYLNENSINAVNGRPIFGVYSYPWKGLTAGGDPQGVLNGKASTEWATIYNTLPLDSMVYNGPVQPTSFGALRNTLAWRRLSLSFNISYQFGSYFRKRSVSYSDIFFTWNGSDDYHLRWQQPGDEKKTHVPSFNPSVNLYDPARDNFYLNSSVLVEKADNIRLEDTKLQYEMTRRQWGWLPFQSVVVYAMASNIGLLWTANKDGIDPRYINTPKEAKHFSFGANIHF